MTTRGSATVAYGERGGRRYGCSSWTYQTVHVIGKKIPAATARGIDMPRCRAPNMVSVGRARRNTTPRAPPIRSSRSTTRVSLSRRTKHDGHGPAAAGRDPADASTGAASRKGSALAVRAASSGRASVHARRGNGQEVAALTSSTTFFSTSLLHALTAYATGHRSPSSRFAVSLKPRVEYRALNLPASWKYTTILPSASA